MPQETMMDKLKRLHEDMVQKHRMHVDVYCNEDARVIIVVPKGAIPIPFHAIEILNF